MQVEPTSVAAEDGRIREGDQIIQVNEATLNSIWLMSSKLTGIFEPTSIIVCRRLTEAAADTRMGKGQGTRDLAVAEEPRDVLLVNGCTAIQARMWANWPT